MLNIPDILKKYSTFTVAIEEFKIKFMCQLLLQMQKHQKK